MSFDVDILAQRLFWLLFETLGDFFKSSGHPVVHKSRENRRSSLMNRERRIINLSQLGFNQSDFHYYVKLSSLTGATTFNITTFSITTLRKMTLSTKGLFATLSINDTQHNSF